jgi:biopolymer transport protein ExbD
MHSVQNGGIQAEPKTILVRGDGRAPYQEIVTAIDIARGAGVRTVGLWTTPR